MRNELRNFPPSVTQQRAKGKGHNDIKNTRTQGHKKTGHLSALGGQNTEYRTQDTEDRTQNEEGEVPLTMDDWNKFVVRSPEFGE